MEHLTIALGEIPESEDSDEVREDAVEAFDMVADELRRQSIDHLSQKHSGLVSEEPFDLRQYFQDSNVKAIKNGGKPKKMGVGVRNVTVVGRAPECSIISTNISPFLALCDYLNPRYWYVHNS